MIVQLDTENADRDISSLVTVLTDTPDASNPMLCQGLVCLGDGSKDLDGTGGDFSLVITVGGQTVQPSPQTVTFGTEIRSSIWTTPFPVPANQAVIMRVLSPNAGDSDVTVTAYLYQVDAVEVVAMAAGTVTAAAIADAAIDNATLAADIGSTAYATNIIALAVRKVLDEIKLDHLVAVADSDDPADDSIVAKLASTDGDWSNFSETTDALQSVRDVVGTPAALDGGAATLGGMLTKMADDNGGADFDAGTDSLQEVRDHIGDGTNLTEAGGTGDQLTEILASVAGIGTAGGAALNTDCATDNYGGGIAGVTSGTTKVGTQTNSYTDTSFLGGNAHIMTHDTQVVDIVYQFLGGGGTSPVEIVWTGCLNPINDTATVQAWKHTTNAWETIGTIAGQTSTTAFAQKNFTLYARHMGTSAAELGKVYLRILSAAAYNHILRTDQVYLSYSVTARTTGYQDSSVWLDTVGGTAGTESYVNGTADNPTLTLANALTIATNVGLTGLRLLPGSSITLTGSVANYRIVGSATIALGGQAISDALVRDAYTISGIGTGDDWRFENCGVGTCTLEHGYMNGCSIKGTITLTAGDEYYLHDCFDAISGGTATFVFAAGAELYARDWRGGIQLNSMAAGDEAFIDGAGRVIIDATCTGGTITIRGPFAVAGAAAFIAAGGTITETQRYDIDRGVTLGNVAHGGAAATITLLTPIVANATQVEGADATDQIRDAVVDDATRIDASALNTLSGHDPGEAIMGTTDLGTGAGLTSLAPAATALSTVQWTNVRAGLLDELAAANIPADVDTLLARLTALRAGYLDELAAGNLPADVAAIAATIAALNNLSQVQAQAAVAAALTAYGAATAANVTVTVQAGD